MPKRILLGALIGGLFAAVDGAIVGLIAKIFFDPDDTWRVVGMWTFFFALIGAILGGLLGMGWKSLVKQMMLRPPQDVPDSEQRPSPPGSAIQG
jgi:hypothetical protein